MFGHRITKVSQTDHHVIVTAETADGLREFEGAYVIGADGGQSAVRESLQIKFEGMTYPERYLSQFTTFEFRDHIPDLAFVNYVADGQDWHVLIRTPTEWRVLFPTYPEETELDDPSLDEARLDAIGQVRLQRVLATGKPYLVVHRRIYRVHQRVAATYRLGRVLLAGDAAHVNNPLGGMGLNGGIHDAVNCSEKLARIWHGQASEELLDAYTAERRQIAIEFVQRQTHRNATAIGEEDLDARRRRNEEMRRIAADPEQARQYLLQSSMIASLTGASRTN